MRVSPWEQRERERDRYRDRDRETERAESIRENLWNKIVERAKKTEIFTGTE